MVFLTTTTTRRDSDRHRHEDVAVFEAFDGFSMRIWLANSAALIAVLAIVNHLKCFRFNNPELECPDRAPNDREFI